MIKEAIMKLLRMVIICSFYALLLTGCGLIKFQTSDGRTPANQPVRSRPPPPNQAPPQMVNRSTPMHPQTPQERAALDRMNAEIERQGKAGEDQAVRATMDQEDSKQCAIHSNPANYMTCMENMRVERLEIARQVVQNLERLNQEASKIDTINNSNAKTAVGIFDKYTLFFISYVMDAGVRRMRLALPVRERPIWDKNISAATLHNARLQAMLRAAGRGGGGSPSVGGTIPQNNPSFEDSVDEERRAAVAKETCRRNCNQNCSSPSGSGAEWEASNREYSQCQSAITSCQNNCR